MKHYSIIIIRREIEGGHQGQQQECCSSEPAKPEGKGTHKQDFKEGDKLGSQGGESSSPEGMVTPRKLQ